MLEACAEESVLSVEGLGDLVSSTWLSETDTLVNFIQPLFTNFAKNEVNWLSSNIASSIKGPGVTKGGVGWAGNWKLDCSSECAVSHALLKCLYLNKSLSFWVGREVNRMNIGTLENMFWTTKGTL